MAALRGRATGLAGRRARAGRRLGCAGVPREAPRRRAARRAPRVRRARGRALLRVAGRTRPGRRPHSLEAPVSRPDLARLRARALAVSSETLSCIDPQTGKTGWGREVPPDAG